MDIITYPYWDSAAHSCFNIISQWKPSWTKILQTPFAYNLFLILWMKGVSLDLS